MLSGSLPGVKLSWREVVLVGSYPGGGVVLVGSRAGGSCPCGGCPGGELSW